MDCCYVDSQGRALTRPEVHRIPAEELAERSGIPVHILPDRETLYVAVADVMIDVIAARQEAKTTMILVNMSTVDMDALVASCGDRAAVPPFAVTLGPHDILRARRTEVVFFAGRFQRFALREVLFRKPTLHFPGTLLKLRKEDDGRLVPQNLRIWATPEEAGPVTAQTI